MGIDFLGVVLLEMIGMHFEAKYSKKAKETMQEVKR